MRSVGWSIALALLLVTMVTAQDQPTLRRVKLLVPTSVDGVLCGPTGRSTAAFYSSGQLESCPLAEDANFFGHRLEAGTWIYFDATGQPRHAWLSSDTELGGYLCRGTGKGGWSVDFYPSGRLRLCYLADETVIDGVPCRKASFWAELTGGVQVTFYESGKLESCGAARDFTMGDRTYRRRDRVELQQDGSPRKSLSTASLMHPLRCFTQRRGSPAACADQAKQDNAFHQDYDGP